jgi:hypothetical protein
MDIQILGAIRYPLSAIRAAEILEYCDKKDLIEKENDYLKLLQPEYNILLKAESRLGHKVSEETRNKMSNTAKEIDHSGRFQAGDNHPNFGKPRVVGAGKSSQQISVTDLKEDTTTSYDSISAATSALNINNTVIVKYFANNQQKPYKGRYFFKKSR